MPDTITNLRLQAFKFLMPVSWRALAVIILILLPMAAFKQTRGTAGSWMYSSSYAFGITGWALGARITSASFGWFGIIFGLIFLGVGVLPLGTLGAWWKMDNGTLFLLWLVVMTLATRFGGFYFMSKANHER